MAVTPTALILDEAVRAWVAAGSGLDFDTAVIPGNDSAPSPEGVYATVLEIDDAREGLDFVRRLQGADEGDEEAQQSSTVRYSVQWFRVGARDAGRCFKLWAPSPAGIAAAEGHGFTFYNVSELRRLDAVDDFHWEERVGLDLSIGVVFRETRTVDLIEGVEADICLDGEQEASVSFLGGFDE